MCLRIKNYFEEKRARKTVLKMDDDTIDQKIKIQGTQFDRKRKYQKELFNNMKAEFNNGVTIKELASKYRMNPMTIRYNIDDAFRVLYNSKRKKGTHAVGVMDFANRVAYKRSLVRSKKIKVDGVVNARV